MAETLSGLELRSLVTPQGDLRVSLEPIALEAPGPDEIVVRVEAAPLNPSDLGLLFGPADLASLKAEGSPESPVLTARIPPDHLPRVQARLGQAMPVGNEGAGTVLRAGANVADLVGRRVAMIGGGMYATLRRLPARDCLILPDDVSAAEGASLFVNPLTALGFVETMRAEGHKGLVHTAAASNLGQMLVRICLADGVPLVNIVRSAAQEKLLRDLGATHVVDSTAEDFQDRLVKAIAATGATLAFDAIGGGELTSHILNAMEIVAARDAKAYSRYGSSTQKQVYIYGSLDTGPVVLRRGFGFTWSVGGWLLFNLLQKAGPDVVARLRKRVVAEAKTTFASRYTATIGLRDVLKPETAMAYQRKGTGAKYLIDPTR